MTPEQKRAKAIEAAVKAFDADRTANKWFDTHRSMKAAIDAYEAAMWRPIEEAQLDVPYYVLSAHGETATAVLHEDGWIHEASGSPGYPSIWQGLHFTPVHFRTLPQPPAQKVK